MKVVIAIDSLKGSLSSLEAAYAIKDGVLSVLDDAEVIVKPLADGGEGSAEALVSGMGGSMKKLMVTGPILDEIEASYGVLDDQTTAIIEMAQAAGLPLVPVPYRNPLNTTTYGVGEMIKKAIDEGCRKFIVGIGGSATNDAGIGMLTALGFKFYDSLGNQVIHGGRELAEIVRVDSSGKLKELDECQFRVACDVSNPLFGKNGAAYIYAPQKGATPEIVEELDRGLESFAKVVATDLGRDYSLAEGAGAAGGLGFAFIAFLNGELESGIKIIMEETGLEDTIKDADLVVTGEGKMDYQTAMGKAPIGVAKLAKKYGLPVIAFAGAITKDAIKCNEEGIDAYFSIMLGPISLEEAMEKEIARENMVQTSRQVFNLIKVMKK